MSWPEAFVLGCVLMVSAIPIIVNIASHDDAEDMCEEKINEFIVRRLIEAMKGESPYYDSDKMWKDLNSTQVWNLCLNYILK